MGKLLPSLEQDLEARNEQREKDEIKRKKDAITRSGAGYLGDEDDLLHEPDGNDREELVESRKQEKKKSLRRTDWI